MTQQVSDPPDPPQPGTAQLLQEDHARPTKASIISFLVFIGLLLLSLSGLALSSLPQLHQQNHEKPAPTAVQASTLAAFSPLSLPANKPVSLLQLPKNHYLVYEQQNNLYVVPITGGLPQLIPTPGYTYSEAVHPIITPTGQLLYSGDGIWLTDIFNGVPTQIANLAPNTIITSMALSSDGTTIAWSTEPSDGKGDVDIYAGPLIAPTLVYEQSAQDCPCFRVFSFASTSVRHTNDTLLLSDDQASHEAVQYGLWSLDLTNPSNGPQPILDEDSLQGPLALAPRDNILLYSTNEGVVPSPTDESVPDDIASLTYANSLDIATLQGQPFTLGVSQVVLPEQRDLNNSAAFHWITTPMFTPDARTLIYVEFSSDSQAPFDRHSALYTVQFTGSGSHLRISRPRLLATASSLLLELGPWLNNRVLTFYSDGTLYALDIHTGAVATILQTPAYAHIVAVVNNLQA